MERCPICGSDTCSTFYESRITMEIIGCDDCVRDREPWEYEDPDDDEMEIEVYDK